MKKLTMTLKYDSWLSDSEKASTTPTKPSVIEFEDSESGELLASQDVTKGDYPNLGEALDGLFFLIGVTALARRKTRTAEEAAHRKKTTDLLAHEKTTELLGKKLYNVVTRKKRIAKWICTLFNENPNNRYLIASKLSVQFSDGFDGGEKIELSVENETTRKELSAAQLVCFCESLLKTKETNHLHKVFARLDFTRRSGESFIVTNRGHKSHLEFLDSFWIEFQSNYPDYFCVFWIDALGRLYELYPDITLDLTNKHHKTKLIRSMQEGSSRLSVPFRSSLGVDTHGGVENIIYLTSNRPFERGQVDDMKERINALLKEDFYCRSDNEFDIFEQYLKAEKEASAAKLPLKMELASPPPTNEWREKIISQMHGFASKIHFIQIAHLPRPL